MKVLQKQIKLTNITKYIHQNDTRWLCLVIPLFLGLILHFIIPVTFVLNANPSAESNFNHQKLTLEQQTVRSLSLLNSQIIRVQIQRYENVRNFLIKIFGQKNDYQNINISSSQITLNNAYEIANNITSGISIAAVQEKSMWFAQGKSTFNQLNPVQQFVYLQYLSVEPFIQSYFLNINNSTQQSVLKGISLSANYLGQGIHFSYPAGYVSQFQSLNNSPFDKYYNLTIYNYQQSNKSFEYMTFSQKINGESQLIICNVIFGDQIPVGVACFYELMVEIAQQVTSSLSLPNIQYSTTSYYLLTPIYPSFTVQNKFQPQIIFNFTDKKSQNISFPIDSFFELPSTMSKKLYIPNLGQTIMNYSVFVTFGAQRTIYFQVPIYIYSYQQVQETILFLLVKYDFEDSVFDSNQKYSQILQNLSIPSSIVIIVSTIISLIVMKCLMNSLDDELIKVNSNCEFLLHGDLDLKIQEYQNTQQLKAVYQNLRMLNYLHKFSTPSYFHESPEGRIIKLYKVLQIFEELKYPTDIVFENLADAYLMMSQLPKAIETLTQSYNMLVEEVQSVFKERLQDILTLKHKENKKLCRKYRKYELKLIGRLFKLILIYSYLMIPPPSITFDKSAYGIGIAKNDLTTNFFVQNEKKLRKYLEIFKKLVYPNFVTSQTVFTYLFEARLQVQKKNFKAAKTILKRFERIMTEYGSELEIGQSSPKDKDDSPTKSYQQMKNYLSGYCRVSPNIMWSAYYFVQGLLLSEQPQTFLITEIIAAFKKTLQGNTFSEDIHLRAISQIIKISYDHQINEIQVRKLISSFTFFKQIFPLYHLQIYEDSNESKKLQLLSRIKKGLQKEVIFLFDCSNRWIKKLEEFRKWQKQTRQLAGKIFGFLSDEDRVSILKVNSTIFVSTACNLIYKKGSESLITKELTDSIKIKMMSGRCKVIDGIKIAIKRIKILEEEKYILVFVKQSKEAVLLSPLRKEKKEKNLSESSSMMLGKFKSHNFIGVKKQRNNTEVSPYHKDTVHSKAESNLNSFEEEQQFGDNSASSFNEYYKNLREQILGMLLAPDVFNLRIIFITSNSQTFKRKFSLSDINRTLEKQYLKRNQNNNNEMFVFEYQNHEEFDRVFKKKNILKHSQNVLYMF